MPNISQQELLDAGVHFGHLKKKWNPKMSPYIFMERKGIHIIDLNKTATSLEKAGSAMRAIARSGRKILFVATKKQAKDIVYAAAQRVNMPYVTERWLGGMLTNFTTIRKSVKKMQNTEKMLSDGTLDNITKKEKLMLNREKENQFRVLGGIASLSRIPSAIFLVDIGHEHIALAEAQRLGITTFGMVDTNADPNKVDFPIPANDDAAKSISVITNYIVECIREGLEERRQERDANGGDAPESEVAEVGGEDRRRLRRRGDKGGDASKED
ncbi:MAG: 30S ribosomal protein S2 [Sphingobacteriales bacterium]|nr:30S ribosomal protein S2 [Sphingobacteriales bacterium]